MTASSDAGTPHDLTKPEPPRRRPRPSWRVVLVTLATLTMIYEQVPLPLWLDGARPALPYLLHGIGLLLLGDLTRNTVGYSRECWHALRERGGIELRWSRHHDGSAG